jgi:hypothetical protein
MLVEDVKSALKRDREDLSKTGGDGFFNPDVPRRLFPEAGKEQPPPLQDGDDPELRSCSFDCGCIIVTTSFI